MQRILHVEDERAADVVVIREQHAARRHFVLGVMDTHRLLVSADACDELAVTGGMRVSVDHRQKVVALLTLVPAHAKR